MAKSIIFTTLLAFMTQNSLADRCNTSDGEFDLNAFSNSVSISVSLHEQTLLIMSNDGQWGRLSLDQLNSLKDVRLKEAIVRSLMNNSSWQQR